MFWAESNFWVSGLECKVHTNVVQRFRCHISRYVTCSRCSAAPARMRRLGCLCRPSPYSCPCPSQLYLKIFFRPSLCISPPKQEQAHAASFEHAINGNASARLEPSKQKDRTLRVVGLAGEWGTGGTAAGGEGRGHGGGSGVCKARHKPNRFNAAVAFACPCAAARRYNRMASALSCATPRPSWNMPPKLN